MFVMAVKKLFGLTKIQFEIQSQRNNPYYDLNAI